MIGGVGRVPRPRGADAAAGAMAAALAAAGVNGDLARLLVAPLGSGTSQVSRAFGQLGEWLPRRLRVLRVLAPFALAPAGDAALSAVSSLSELETLELDLAAPPASASLAHLTALTSLTLRWGSSSSQLPMMEQTWDWDPAPLPAQLRSLNLESTGGTGIGEVPWRSSCTSLTRLVAKGKWLAWWLLSPLQLHSLRHLEELDLVFELDETLPLAVPPGNIVEVTGSLTRLRSLRIAVAWQGPPPVLGLGGAPAPDDLSPLSALSRLESLVLGPGLGPTLLPLRDLVPGLTGLTSLEVGSGESERAGDEHLACLGALSRLQRLAVADGSAALWGQQQQGAGFAAAPPMQTAPGPLPITGSGLDPLARAGALRSLTLGRCRALGAPGLRAAARLRATLVRLELAGCTGVDDSAFAHLRDLTRLTRACVVCVVVAGRFQVVFLLLACSLHT